MIIEQRYGWKAVLWGFFFAVLAVGFIWHALQLLDPGWQAQTSNQQIWESVPPLLRTAIFLAFIPLFAPVALSALLGGLTRATAFQINEDGVTSSHMNWLWLPTSIKWNEVEAVKVQSSVILLQVAKPMRKLRPWLSRSGVAIPIFYTSSKQDDVLAAIAHYRPDLFALPPTPA